ncbi:WecB/TagA/CpsF family glycosyltransferase [Sinorhizobium numidicum]|uniref:WecB/TagA/CpsF family glycosyltransferase n=1 Tax=Sinorhizobium numidicum TaxID=680248 RepID=A0ABY8CVB8_9HYPH|nr:WecB/TagA/CpsF family glycosyltransferase [Sinorhizobium numidicum]WEX74943.1 WecB/TagA/CpsF family glycosyltransferase [Sinorhizobium numidicum]WEX80936.1 WecB/TagA/CpsF family glycosyltransferase [Sinorhizobium numidicum]
MAGSALLSPVEVYDARRRHYFLGAPFDCIAKKTVVDLVNNCGSDARFRYVVTPNVDHVVRLNKNTMLAPCYDHAWLSLCDSQPIARLAKILSLDLPLVTGSDLTAVLFSSVIQNGDRITLIAANATIVRALELAYPGVCFRGLVPPDAVGSDPAALEDCVDFAIREGARFIFIAIGSPQSEKIAHAMLTHPEAQGIGFCVGASLEFLIGSKKRAPAWMRRAGIEWLHRLASDPKRLWRRYVFAIVPLIRLFAGEVARRHYPRLR